MKAVVPPRSWALTLQIANQSLLAKARNNHSIVKLQTYGDPPGDLIRKFANSQTLPEMILNQLEREEF